MALYDMPVLTGKRGRPAKYGLKSPPERVEALEETVEELWLYGKKQKIHYRNVQCLAGFRKGRLVKVVWTQFGDSDRNLRKSRLLLSTNPALSAREIILSFGAIENLFNQIKNSWDGVKPGNNHVRFFINGLRYYMLPVPSLN
jgi:hypothetical protein